MPLFGRRILASGGHWSTCEGVLAEPTTSSWGPVVEYDKELEYYKVRTKLSVELQCSTSLILCKHQSTLNADSRMFMI